MANNNRSFSSGPAGADSAEPGMFEKVVFINRCAKVVKGGRRFSFSALSVVGDGKGSVGIGYGKANEVPDAIKKSTESAKKRMVSVKLKGSTIPHEVLGEFDGGKVFLRPASNGTGLIAPISDASTRSSSSDASASSARASAPSRRRRSMMALRSEP